MCEYKSCVICVLLCVCFIVVQQVVVLFFSMFVPVCVPTLGNQGQLDGGEKDERKGIMLLEICYGLLVSNCLRLNFSSIQLQMYWTRRNCKHLKSESPHPTPCLCFQATCAWSSGAHLSCGPHHLHWIHTAEARLHGNEAAGVTEQTTIPERWLWSGSLLYYRCLNMYIPDKNECLSVGNGRLAGQCGKLQPWWLKSGFMSTETIGLLGTGTQNVHLDFHTAPELCLNLAIFFSTINGIDVKLCVVLGLAELYHTCSFSDHDHISKS